MKMNKMDAIRAAFKKRIAPKSVSKPDLAKAAATKIHDFRSKK